jgi:hypothetical protein
MSTFRTAWLEMAHQMFVEPFLRLAKWLRR